MWQAVTPAKTKREREREEKGHRQRELRQLSALQPSRTRTHCAASVRGSVCTHVSPHVAHVCATLRLAVPRQGHDADADADGHARNAVAAFIELAPDFLWAILLSLSLSRCSSLSLLHSIGSCHCGRVLKVTRTHARCSCNCAAARSTQASAIACHMPRSKQQATRNLQQCGAVGCRS